MKISKEKKTVSRSQSLASARENERQTSTKVKVLIHNEESRREESSRFVPAINPYRTCFGDICAVGFGLRHSRVTSAVGADIPSRLGLIRDATDKWFFFFF